jgi:hypothetical protein
VGCASIAARARRSAGGNWPSDPALGLWLAKQRWLNAKAKLDLEKKQRLEEVGVQWGIKKIRLAPKPAANWMARYQQLLSFKQQHGHCNVASSPLQSAGLGGWVSRQRNAHKSGKLLPERERLLNETGFVWSLAQHINAKQESPR